MRCTWRPSRGVPRRASTARVLMDDARQGRNSWPVREPAVRAPSDRSVRCSHIRTWRSAVEPQVDWYEGRGRKRSFTSPATRRSPCRDPRSRQCHPRCASPAAHRDEERRRRPKRPAKRRDGPSLREKTECEPICKQWRRRIRGSGSETTTRAICSWVRSDRNETGRQVLGLLPAGRSACRRFVRRTEGITRRSLSLVR